MRLFYAINFDSIIKKQLTDIQDLLRTHSLKGNFTLPDNLHLTLAFIGEVASDKTGPLLQIAETFKVTPFELRLQGLGRFRRDGGDILWLGIAENKTLTSIYSRLYGYITGAGFTIEKRKFTPHLTLARQARLHTDFDLSACSEKMNPIAAEVIKISLMKSERINGRLTYT
ncbi:MAG: RNA 2',3'-cyclic phosphodiesterase, partial [Clostridiales bacterium]|nr:RNA 2',3'-cyclic phosphodiesterase [Clostridiales bacterium]